MASFWTDDKPSTEQIKTQFMWFQKLAFGFLSPAPEDAEMNSKLCQDCSVWFETFDQPMSFIPSVFKTNIFTFYTTCLTHFIDKYIPDFYTYILRKLLNTLRE